DGGGEVERGEPVTVAAGPMVPAAHAGTGDADHPSEHDEPQGESSAGPSQPAERPRPVGGRFHHIAGKERVRQSLVKAIFSPCPHNAMPGGSASPGTWVSAAQSRCWWGPRSGAESSGCQR